MIMKNKKIVDYLCGPRVYVEGVALYRAFGHNKMLLQRFIHDRGETTTAILFDELRRLAGLTENEYRHLPRLAKAKPYKESDNLSPEETPTAQPAPAQFQKIIKIREKYPFLNDATCPDQLKIAVSDMISAYGRYKSAHQYLLAHQDAPAAECAEKCREVVEAYLENRQLWDELDYYKEHGSMLGKAAATKPKEPVEDLSVLSDVDLLRKLQSAKVNVSKQRRRLADAGKSGTSVEAVKAALQNWEARKAALEAETENRKKK